MGTRGNLYQNESLCLDTRGAPRFLHNTRFAYKGKRGPGENCPGLEIQVPESETSEPALGKVSVAVPRRYPRHRLPKCSQGNNKRVSGWGKENNHDEVEGVRLQIGRCSSCVVSVVRNSEACINRLLGGSDWCRSVRIIAPFALLRPRKCR